MTRVHATTLPRAQRGIALIITSIGIVALIAMAGLALDMGDVYINKTRLQNALDAAALSGAKELVVSGGDMAAATAAARNTFALNKDEGNEALTVIPNDQVNVEFSASLIPWIRNSGPTFIRVWINPGTFNRPSFLIQVLGIANKPVVASATAGPDQTSCANLFPLLACGDDSTPLDNPPGPHDPPNNYYGYEIGDEVVLKIHAGPCPDPPEPDNPDPCNGPGNFNVLDVGSGANAVRDALCGMGEFSCAASGDLVETEPGNMVGPVGQGLNTMFNIYQGAVSPADCPSDTKIYEYPDEGIGPSYFDDYKNAAPNVPGGVAGRRVVPVPIGICTEDEGGKKDVTILDTMCFLVLRPAEQSGNTQFVFGEFLGPEGPDGVQCLGSGESTPDPTVTGGPVIIVLYKDQFMNDG